MGIDWTNPAEKITPHFTVKDALWLPTWGRLANESDGLDDTIKANLIQTCEIMERIRVILGVPINVNCMYRPKNYNAIIPGAAAHSAHVEGLACDYEANLGMGDLVANCNEARKILLPCLEQFQIRMENKPDGNWVHNDLRPVPAGGHRYFIP